MKYFKIHISKGNNHGSIILLRTNDDIYFFDDTIIINFAIEAELMTAEDAKGVKSVEEITEKEYKDIMGEETI